MRESWRDRPRAPRLSPDQVRLSVVMPAYNEERTVKAAVLEVLGAHLPCDFEVIVVDDGSTDGTSAALASISDPRLRVYRHLTNLGKGTALATGRRLATGTHVVPFDADREYSAADLALVIEPVLEFGCPVVLGNRNGMRAAHYAAFRYAFGNRVMTVVADILYHSEISDLHTCLKLVSVDLLHRLPLREPGFGADTELVAEILRRGITPYEVPIHYRGRTRLEGKKICWRDAAQCCAILVTHRLGRPKDLPDPVEVIDLTDAEPAPLDGASGSSSWGDVALNVRGRA